MKKLLLASAVVLGVPFAKAQESATPFSKGDKFITGTLGFTYQSYEKDRTDKKNSESTLKLQPGFGYFVTDNWAVGGTLGYERESTKFGSDSNLENIRNKFTANPMVARYFYVGSNNFVPFLELQGTLGWSNRKKSATAEGTKITTQDKDNDKFVWGVNLRPGFNYKLSPKVALGATVGRFGYNNDKDQDGSQNYGFGFNLRDVSFGVLVFL